MDLTWLFVFFSLLFFTPSLILIGIFRTNYPIHRTVASLKDGVLFPILAFAISFFINGTLLLDYVFWALSSFNFKGISHLALNSVFSLTFMKRYLKVIQTPCE